MVRVADIDLVEVWEKTPGREYLLLLGQWPFDPEADPPDTYVSETNEIYRTTSFDNFRNPDGTTVCRVVMEKTR